MDSSAILTALPCETASFRGTHSLWSAPGRAHSTLHTCRTRFSCPSCETSATSRTRAICSRQRINITFNAHVHKLISLITTHRLFFGTNNDTVKAKSCHPWINVKFGGFDLQSMAGIFVICMEIREKRLYSFERGKSHIELVKFVGNKFHDATWNTYLSIRRGRATISLWRIIVLGITSEQTLCGA